MISMTLPLHLVANEAALSTAVQTSDLATQLCCYQVMINSLWFLAAVVASLIVFHSPFVLAYCIVAVVLR